MPPVAIFLKPVPSDGSPVVPDGFDLGTQYQMVPVGGSRKVLLFTDGNEWMMITGGAAGALRLTFPPTPPVTTEVVSGLTRFIIPKFAMLELTLGGESAGAADVILQPRDFSVTKSLRVSVKNKQQKKYAIRMLSDIRRSTTRTKADASAVMVRVSDLFLQQTNTELTPVGDPVDMTVSKDLGIPLFLDSGTNLSDIAKATPGAVTDFWVYCTWDVADKVHGTSPVGETTGRMCFVEDGAAANTPKGLQVFAHEIGHAFGLDHQLDADRLMFAHRNGSTRLTQLEIDKVNPSASGT